MSTWLVRGRRLRPALTAAVVLLAALGAGMLSAALHGSPPQPVDTRAAGPSTDSARPGRAGYPRTAVSAAPPSEPVHITISRIGVDADVIALGVADDGTLEVPPLKRAYLTGWYRAGPTPGEVGTLVAIYMLAAAAGGLVPGPGGLGSTEAALVGLLALTGTQTALALSGVLIFRAVTHWAPVPIGLLFAGTLRRRREERAAGTRALPGRVPVRVIAEEFFGPLAKRYAFLVKPETQRP